MKKNIIITIAIGSLLLTGCGTEEQELMECSRSMNQNDLEMINSYEVLYTGDYVDSIKTIEIVKADIDTLETLEGSLSSIYDEYVKLEGYSNEVTIEGDTLTSVTNVDYNVIDTDKMLEIDSANGLLIKDGKVKVDDIESTYTSMGIMCER